MLTLRTSPSRKVVEEEVEVVVEKEEVEEEEAPRGCSSGLGFPWSRSQPGWEGPNCPSAFPELWWLCPKLGMGSTNSGQRVQDLQGCPGWCWHSTRRLC